ncbi:MAG: ABC transporter substrate-binding protein, partial [Chloroflexota bacterium]|nr:ABC transporter substrate-binding protein [Chloroflexota bacterium]
MTRPETRDAEQLMRNVAQRRLSRRGLMQGAAAAGLVLPAAGASFLTPRASFAAQDEPIGASLIGELEGPTVLVDAPRPETLTQAPMLDALVEDGTLPPVEERVPLQPLVVQPLEGIGTYGGTLRRGFTGPGDDENGNRYVSGDKLVFWDYTGTEFRPALARSWEFSDGDRVFTITLREGHKWSDGAPFTADDFVYWYDNMLLNTDLTPAINVVYRSGE